MTDHDDAKRHQRREVLVALAQTEPGRRKLAQIYRASCPHGKILITPAEMIDAILRVEFPEHD